MYQLRRQILFRARRKYRLEMRALFLARYHRDLNVLEAGRFEKLMELHFAEAEPVIGVKLAGAFETVVEQIEDHDAAAFAQDAMGARDGALGMDGVMQRLAQNREIYRAFRDRWIFDVAEAIFEIGEAVLLGELRAELNHLRRIIDRDNVASGLGEQLRKRSFAGAQIGHGERGEQRDQSVGERLPGSARHITAAEFSGELVEVLARFVAAFSQRELERGAVPRCFRHFAREGANQLGHFCPGRVAFLFRGQSVVNIFPRAPVFDDAGPFQLREMARDSRLPHPKNFLKLGHGKLVLLEEKQEPKPGRIGQELKKIYG